MGNKMREKNSVLSNTWVEKKEETSILEKWGTTREQIDKARSEVMGKDNRKQIERLVAYGFSSVEIQYLEKKVRGISRDYVSSSQLLDHLEKALGVNKNSSDLEKAYFKLKVKEMTRVGTDLSLDYSWYYSFIDHVKPLDTVVLSKLEFYDFTYKDFMKIKSDLLPYLEKIITDVEWIYNIPENLSKQTKEQVKNHLLQVLECSV